MRLEFIRDLDMIATYIVQGEEHNMTYSEKLLSEMSGIPIETIRKITAKLRSEDYIKTAKAGGNSGLILMPTDKLRALVASSSFEDEYEDRKSKLSSNFINAPNNQGVIFQGGEIIGNKVSQSFNEDLPAEKPNIQESKEHKKITPTTIIKSLWDIVTKNPLISAIIATIIATLILKSLDIM